MTETNWAGNLHYGAMGIATPHSLPELQELVALSPRVRALGSRHSFSAVADTDGQLVSLAGLSRVVTVDASAQVATVPGGMSYGEVASALHRAGWALPNLASLPHISVAGACATGTHGSGDGNQGLAGTVRAMTVVGPDGVTVEVAPDLDRPRFDATVVGLGGMGIIVGLTLAVEPTYEVEQQVYDDVPFDAFLESAADILASAYSVSLFTDFQARIFHQVWRKQRVGVGAGVGVAVEPTVWPAQWFGAPVADGPRHPVPGMSPAACTTQQGIAGPWHERLPHFRLDFQPSSGDELQSEYLVDRAVAADAFAALTAIAPEIAPALQVAEIRSVAADDLWLSPAYGRPTVALHFTWHSDPLLVDAALALIERRLEPYDPRPHWGKVHRFPPARLRSAYPRLGDYLAERRRIDPDDVFANPFLDSLRLRAVGEQPRGGRPG